mmetsp:Transcript_1448/g.1746  ORF Transcript_1448/g.1746 Transcript_1448/m.1746 type:complete len:83 (+) Transcript_1448:203-451(+)
MWIVVAALYKTQKQKPKIYIQIKISRRKREGTKERRFVFTFFSSQQKVLFLNLLPPCVKIILLLLQQKKKHECFKIKIMKLK